MVAEAISDMKISFITPARLRTSQAALGCVTFGREIDKDAAHELMDYAYSKGICLFDTAQAYGNGASEAIVGEWIATRRPPPHAVTVATKILPPYDPVTIADAFGESLVRLEGDAIDLFYLHRWDESAETLEALAALDGLVQSGFVRALGVSNFNLPQLERVIALQEKLGLTKFSVLQNNQNVAVSDITPDMLRFCSAKDISIITYSPLGAGFLTGKHKQGVEPGSRFDMVPGHQDIYFRDEAYRRLARLEFIASRTGKSKEHLALAWAFHRPQVASVLIGGRVPSHVDQALAAMDYDDEEIFMELGADTL